MANEVHLAILAQGVEVWNKWREEESTMRPDLSYTIFGNANFSGLNLFQTNLIQTDLRGADLTEADLSRADISWADFSKASLVGTDLSWANLTGTDLIGADLTAAILNGTNFDRVDLRGAILIGADLTEAHFSNADLNDSNLTETYVGYSAFDNVDLINVNGLETVTHLGPSTIGIDTIYQSKGKIPEVFLRGCGLSDVQIEMAKLHNPDLSSEQITAITYRIHELLVLGAIHYHSCFISYSSKDEAFARRLHTDLQQKGVRCWFAPENMKIGDKIRPAIDQSIRVHDKLLIIISEHSIKSAWVEKEVETAFEEESKRKQTVLFPVKLDEAVMETNQAWAADIRRTRHIGNFRWWKDYDAYQRAFERLLRDLKAEG